ncbi:MAG TPA: DUF2127 domain-containing protein [Acidisarcina sp.]
MRSNSLAHHNRWLILIGMLKLLRALLLILVGFGVLKLLHKDLVVILTRLAMDLRFDPESHFINIVLDKVSLINAHRLRQISALAFCVGALDITEGIGLMLEKPWAEYLTLVLTASFLPWEFFEIVRRASWLKAGLTVINVLVVIYLVFHVQAGTVRRRRLRQRPRS